MSNNQRLPISYMISYLTINNLISSSNSSFASSIIVFSILLQNVLVHENFLYLDLLYLPILVLHINHHFLVNSEFPLSPTTPFLMFVSLFYSTCYFELVRKPLTHQKKKPQCIYQISCFVPGYVVVLFNKLESLFKSPFSSEKFITSTISMPSSFQFYRTSHNH